MAPSSKLGRRWAAFLGMGLGSFSVRQTQASSLSRLEPLQTQTFKNKRTEFRKYTECSVGCQIVFLVVGGFKTILNRVIFLNLQKGRHTPAPKNPSWRRGSENSEFGGGGISGISGVDVFPFGVQIKEVIDKELISIKNAFAGPVQAT